MLLAGESVTSLHCKYNLVFSENKAFLKKLGCQQSPISNFTNFTGRHHIRSKILVDGQTALHMTALHTVIIWV